MPHRRFLSALVALALACLGCSSAYAGQYTLTYDFARDLSGWSGYVEPGYVLCGRGATAGCPDVSTNRILAQPGAGQAVWSQGRWEWTAPPGTQIVGGSLAYRTRMRHSQFYARVKMRADGVTWDAAPTIVNEQQTTALTDHVIPLAGGFRQVGVALYAHPAAAGLVTDPWDDYVTLVRMVVTVQDATPPALIWVDGGGLLDGAWHRGDVCATFGLGDRESGAGAVWLASGAASAVWNATPTRLAVSAGRRLWPAHALPGSGGARRRHPRGCRRGSGRQRRAGRADAVHGAHRRHAAVGAPARARCRRIRRPPGRRARSRRCRERHLLGAGPDRWRDACRWISPERARAGGPARGWPTARTRSHGRSSTRRATATEGSTRFDVPDTSRRRSAPRSRRTAHRSPPARC